MGQQTAKRTITWQIILHLFIFGSMGYALFFHHSFTTTTNHWSLIAGALTTLLIWIMSYQKKKLPPNEYTLLLAPLWAHPYQYILYVSFFIAWVFVDIYKMKIPALSDGRMYWLWKRGYGHDRWRSPLERHPILHGMGLIVLYILLWWDLTLVASILFSVLFSLMLQSGEA